MSTSPKDVELRQIVKVEDVQDTYLTSLEATYRKLQAKLIKDLKAIADEGRTVDTALAMQDIGKALTDTGLYSTGSAVLDEGASEALKAARETYATIYGKQLQYNDTAKNFLNSMRQYSLSDFQVISNDLMTQVSKLYTDLSFGAVSFDAASAQVERLLEVSAGQAKTWVRTSMASIHRASTVTLGEELGIKRYQYVGPDDKVTRPFCEQHLDQIKTMDEWKALPNGQIGTAATMGGGYNCRHRLVPVGQI